MKADPRYVLWIVLLICVAALPFLAGFVGWAWELAEAAGLVGAVACIALCGAPVRPRNAIPPTGLTLSVHTFIGWIAVAAVLIHIAVLLLSDRLVLEYLKPTTPLYQWSGILGGAILLVLVLCAGAAMRRRLWSSHRGFQAFHVILGCTLLVLIGVHVVTTDRYTGTAARRGLFLASGIGALLLLLRFRRPTPGTMGRSPRLVFGRNSTWVAVVAVVCGAGLLVLAWPAPRSSLLEPAVRRGAAMPLDFPHGKHTGVNCLVCHHNYKDGDFSNTCIACHRNTRVALKMGVEARFHEFCFECHRHPDKQFDHHGPIGGCVACHRPAGALSE